MSSVQRDHNTHSQVTDYSQGERKETILRYLFGGDDKFIDDNREQMTEKLYDNIYL